MDITLAKKKKRLFLNATYLVVDGNDVVKVGHEYSCCACALKYIGYKKG